MRKECVPFVKITETVNGLIGLFLKAKADETSKTAVTLCKVMFIKWAISALFNSLIQELGESLVSFLAKYYKDKCST